MEDDADKVRCSVDNVFGMTPQSGTARVIASGKGTFLISVDMVRVGV